MLYKYVLVLGITFESCVGSLCCVFLVYDLL